PSPELPPSTQSGSWLLQGSFAGREHTPSETSMNSAHTTPSPELPPPSTQSGSWKRHGSVSGRPHTPLGTSLSSVQATAGAEAVQSASASAQKLSHSPSEYQPLSAHGSFGRLPAMSACAAFA